MAQATLRDEVKVLWLEALRSGRYTQGTGTLTSIDGDTPDGPGVTRGERRDCCLGVLCDVAILNGLPVTVTETSESDGGVRLHYDGEDGLLPASVWTWATGQVVPASDRGAYDFDVDVPNKHYTDENDEPETLNSQLAEENDGGMDYDGIAALIEAQL